METITGISEIKEKLKAVRRQGNTVGFVPTMGYFHHGHEALIKKAREENDIVVISIYVNPTQFGPKEDFQSYPKDMQRDSEIASDLGVDYLFTPDTNEVYPDNYLTYVEVEKMSQVLCGKNRPAHFKGVATIVLKLLNIVQPNKAYFGLKDYQQFRIIEKMLDDLNLDIQLVAIPTVRDNDGIAASSRNAYLSYDEREQATCLFQALSEAREAFERGTESAADLIAVIQQIIDKRPLVQLEYIHVIDKQNLDPLDKVLKDKTLIALAAQVGKARLIDNIEI